VATNLLGCVFRGQLK